MLHNLESSKDSPASSLANPGATPALKCHHDHPTSGSSTSKHGADVTGDAARPTWATKLDLDDAMLERLLERYQTMQHHFPFVRLPAECNVQSMLESRPYLLLAATANAASHCSDLQEKLAKELRDLFAQRIVVECETSLDVLQAMLVYLAWSHYYIIPRSQQAYKYMQMAIGILVDLGLDNDPNAIQHLRPDVHMRMRIDEFRTNTDGTSQISAEAQRTSLGCWYLSSVISSSMLKPNTLRWTKDVLERAKVLDAASVEGSDFFMLPLLRYQQIIESVRDNYNEASKIDDPALLPTYAMHMIKDLDVWWGTLPEHLRATGLFHNRYHAAKVHVYELGMLLQFRKSAHRNRAPYDLESSLLKCVEAIKCYLDSFLAIDITTYNSLPVEEWMRLIITFFILYKLSDGSRDIPDWNVDLCRNKVNIEAYLATVARRIRSTRSSLDLCQPERDELYFVLPLVLESARHSYVLARDAPLLVRPGQRVHIDMSRSRRAEGGKTAASRASKCPATAFWVDKAIKIDHGSDWHGVTLPNHATHPADQMAKSNDLWNELLGMADESG